MNTGGWIMLVLSWLGIGTLTIFTVYRTLRAKPRDLSAPLDIEARIEQAESEKDGKA